MNTASHQFPPDPLCDLPARYWDSGSLRDFMEAAAPWIMEFCSHRLDSDPDVVGDFFVYFYERAESCLEKYKTRRHLPFTGYLATYLRHEYFNFMRPRKFNRVREFSVDEVFEEAPRWTPDSEDREGGSRRVSGGDPHAKALDVLSERMALLPLRLRLPLKLLYGVNLNREELRGIVESSDSPASAAEFMLEFNRRRENLVRRMAKLRNRAAHLDYLIHSNPRRTGIKAGPVKWRRWKERIIRMLGGGPAVFTQVEIAELLGVNRSTISRRIEKARLQLGAETPWKKPTKQ